MKRRSEPTPAMTGTVPDEFRVGPLADVWADGPHDLGTAYVRHSRARMAWERAAGLDTALACAIAPVSGPWSLDGPHGVERLAALGLTPDDLPRLRRAAGTHDTTPNRRTTT